MRLCDVPIGGEHPIFIIAGPCVIESEVLALNCAIELARIRDKTGLLVIFKASIDKANRTSAKSFRGLGLHEGLEILARVREITGLPILTDVHEIDQVEPIAEVVDVLQTPAFLARQTDFIRAVARAGLPMNIKKGQWMAPGDMAHVKAKCELVGNPHVMLCERGTSFGYGNLVVDMRSLPIMSEIAPVVFDATHSCQSPGGLGDRSGGDGTMAPYLARAAVAAGVAGVFMETHPDPARALSDGPNMIPLGHMAVMVEQLIAIDSAVKGYEIWHGYSQNSSRLASPRAS